MTQLALFDAPLAAGETTIRTRPLCMYEKHSRCQGSLAVLGPPVDHGGCINRSIRCLTCGATGEQSTRTDL